MIFYHFYDIKLFINYIHIEILCSGKAHIWLALKLVRCKVVNWINSYNLIIIVIRHKNGPDNFIIIFNSWSLTIFYEIKLFINNIHIEILCSGKAHIWLALKMVRCKAANWINNYNLIIIIIKHKNGLKNLIIIFNSLILINFLCHKTIYK